MISRLLSFWSTLAILAVTLAACSPSDETGFVHIEEGAAETQAAATVAHTSPTPGSSPTPLPTLKPFAIPTNPPGTDPDTVITRVGSETITLAEFQKQVRFERWYLLYQLALLVEDLGTDQVLDLRSRDNQWVSSLFTTLADSYGFGEQVHRIMVIDAITLQEAIRRGMEVNPYQFNARLAQYLLVDINDDGTLPPEFDREYANFLRQLRIYTGMTEEEFRRVVRARTLYTQLQFAISNTPGATAYAEQEATGVQVQDLTIYAEADAQAVVTRLQAGESVHAIAASMDMEAQSDIEWRVVSANDKTLPANVREALFSAQPGDIVGPISTSRGWYVARVGSPMPGTLTPDELDALRERYFLNWVESKMDDPAYVQDFGNWYEVIPQEPLPQDVSPLLRDENVILPRE